MAITTAAVLQFVHRPYWDKRVNYLDCLCCISILLHCIASLYFNNELCLSDDGSVVLDALLVLHHFFSLQEHWGSAALVQ